MPTVFNCAISILYGQQRKNHGFEYAVSLRLEESMKRFLSLLCTCICMSTLIGGDSTGTIIVEVSPCKKFTGSLYAALFASADGFPDKADKVYRTEILTVTAETNYIEFKNIPYGTYAISVYHDVNGNGKMDMGAFGPLEPYGFSNNAKAIFSAPPFSKAAFVLNSSEVTISIKLRQ